MRPWFDWLEYLGADAIGRAIGLWFKFCLSLMKKVVRLFTRTVRYPANSAIRVSKPDNLAPFGAALRRDISLFSRVIRIVILTALILGIWRILTLKAVWLAAGVGGDRILAAVLLLVSASWVISVFWICFSKSKQTAIGAATTRLRRKPKYTGSPRARAS